MKKLDKYGLALKNILQIQTTPKCITIGLSEEARNGSFKALSLIMKKLIKSNDKVLDVGCAYGHFYRSLLKRVNKKFFYTGCDIAFLKLAKKAWKKMIMSTLYKGIFLNFHLKIIILIMFFAQMFCCIYQKSITL